MNLGEKCSVAGEVSSCETAQTRIKAKAGASFFFPKKTSMQHTFPAWDYCKRGGSGILRALPLRGIPL